MKNLLLLLVAVLCIATAHAQTLLVNTTSTNASCSGSADGTVTATVSNGTPPYTYEWGVLGQHWVGSAPTVTGLGSDFYSVTVTDAVGNFGLDTVVILAPPPLVITFSVTPASCNAFDGRVILTVSGGTAPYTYQWSNGSTAQNLFQINAGTFTLTLTDANGCTATQTAVVTATTTLNLNTWVDYDTCQGTACIITQTVPNAMYIWSNGATTAHICSLTNGVYNLTVTSPSGCTATNSQTVNNSTGLGVVATATAASCANDGVATATATRGWPPYTFVWSTNPPTTTAVATGLSAGTYTVTVTDADGCMRTTTVTVPSSSFNIDSLVITPTSCQTGGDGAAAIYVNGTNPPFTYNWGGLPATGNMATGLPIGTYTVVITDAVGCSFIQTFTVTSATFNVSTGIVAQSNCLTGQGGSIYALPLTGQAPYAYTWSNGLTADTLTGLATGGYTVTITDANGCSAVRHQFLTSSVSCLAKVSGRVYLDTDADCDYTGADFGVHGALVNFSSIAYAYTQPNGTWEVYLAPGTYQAKVANHGNLTNLTNACGIDSVTINVTDTTAIANIEFPKETSVMSDVGITVSCGVARPGFTQTIFITINNYGFTTATGHGSVVLDGVFPGIVSHSTAFGITIDSTTHNPTTVHFSYTGLAPQQSKHFYVYGQVPTLPTVNMGQMVTHNGNITITNQTDQATANNSYSCSTTITGSYDPNDKQVFDTDGGSIDGPAAVEDTLLRYLIRFQNTGTDTAFTVVVRDTIDGHLDLGTFRFIAASHNVDIEFHEGGIVHFVFNNILLPDSNVNEPMSHGFIEFDIEVKDKQALEEITNQAAIYFDFNPPIYTNTVATQRTVGIKETAQVPVHVFPNPTTGLLSVNLGGLPVEQVELYDLAGRKVLSYNHAPLPQANMDATALPSGLYIVRIRSGATWYMDKVVVNR